MYDCKRYEFRGIWIKVFPALGHNGKPIYRASLDLFPDPILHTEAYPTPKEAEFAAEEFVRCLKAAEAKNYEKA